MNLNQIKEYVKRELHDVYTDPWTWGIIVGGLWVWIDSGDFVAGLVVTAVVWIVYEYGFKSRGDKGQ